MFVTMGGEAEAGPSFCNKRADTHSALVLGVEHRFYGLSVPKGGSPLSRDMLDYLSVEQNLADTVGILNDVKAKYKAGPGFAFGGSYSGATCAWFRLTYPESVAGCISESGVVNAILNFTEFDEQVGLAVGIPSEDCRTTLVQGIQALDRAFANGKDVSVKTRFNATNLIGSQNGDADFMYAVADGIAMLDQYGHKDEICKSFQDLSPTATDDERIDNLGFILSRYYGNTFVSGCFYDSVCIRDKTSGPSEGVGDRQWRWQKCSQLAYLQSAPRSGAVRSKLLSLEALLAQCRFMFGDSTYPNTTLINQKFGGDKPNGSRVFFINYSDDPWQRASVTSDVSPDLPACMTTCNGCGHCGAGVPESVGKACEDRADMYIKQWLMNASRGA